MGRYLLFFSYLGNRYRGLQKQPKNPIVFDVDCIQGVIETACYALKPAILNPPTFVSSSRTDAGVHALRNSAHIEIDNKTGLLYHPETIVRTFNRHFLRCKHEIRLLECIPITPQFHARYSAKSRTYLFRIMTAKRFGDRGAPILEMNRSSLVGLENFDIEKAKEATKLFVGLRDFRTFAAADRSKRNLIYRREIDEFTIERGAPLLAHDPLNENFDFWDIKVKGRSFLHNQVRRMVGAICALGAGRVTEKEVVTMLQVPSHSNWNSKIVTAPANGLYLVKVEYDPLHLKQHTISYNETEFLQIPLELET